VRAFFAEVPSPRPVERKADDEARHVLALREVSQRGDEGAPVSRVERSARVRHEPQIVVDRHAHTRAPRIERAGAARTALRLRPRLRDSHAGD